MTGNAERAAGQSAAKDMVRGVGQPSAVAAPAQTKIIRIAAATRRTGFAPIGERSRRLRTRYETEI